MTTAWPSANPDPPQHQTTAAHTAAQRRAATPATLTVIPLADRFGEGSGHRPGDPYVEFCYLPILGPSATWCWQRLARLAAARPATTIDTVDLAVSLGLSESLEPNKQISRTLHRLSAFDVATLSGDTLAVRRRLPDLPDRHLHRLSYTARLAHERWAHPTPTPTPTPAASVGAGIEL